MNQPSVSPSPASPASAPESPAGRLNWFLIGGGIAVALVLGFGIWFALTFMGRD